MDKDVKAVTQLESAVFKHNSHFCLFLFTIKILKTVS